jgi:hypothetical protein
MLIKKFSINFLNVNNRFSLITSNACKIKYKTNNNRDNFLSYNKNEIYIWDWMYSSRPLVTATRCQIYFLADHVILPALKFYFIILTEFILYQ